MKKKYIIAIFIGVVLLLGLVLVLTLGGNREKLDKDNANDMIVHESNEDTVEEEAEGGLKDSDSEDGPALDEGEMIDFYASENSDAKDGEVDKPVESDKSTEVDKPSENDKPSESDKPSENDKPSDTEEESKDTGIWGAFY